MSYQDCFTDGEPSVWLLSSENQSGELLAKNFDEFVERLYFEDFAGIPLDGKDLEDWGEGEEGEEEDE
jgi:hypothetical protein